LKPEELGVIVTLAKETNKPIPQLILEAARKLADRPQALSNKAQPQETGE
jgi:hypothetical protein